jgi:hypothetical protein
MDLVVLADDAFSRCSVRARRWDFAGSYAGGASDVVPIAVARRRRSKC